MSETKITTYPLDGVEYSAEDAAAHFVLRTDGVFDVKNDFKTSVADDGTVTVSAGIAFVRPSRFAGYSIVMREPTTLKAVPNDTGLRRYDRVVLRFDAVERKSFLMILQGEPAGAPQGPNITRTESIYDLGLAVLAAREDGTFGFSQDTRKDNTVCGWAVDDGFYTNAVAEMTTLRDQTRTAARQAASNSSMSSSYAKRAEDAALKAEGYADELKALLDSKS